MEEKEIETKNTSAEKCPYPSVMSKPHAKKEKKNDPKPKRKPPKLVY